MTAVPLVLLMTSLCRSLIFSNTTNSYSKKSKSYSSLKKRNYCNALSMLSWQFGHGCIRAQEAYRLCFVIHHPAHTANLVVTPLLTVAYPECSLYSTSLPWLAVSAAPAVLQCAIHVLMRNSGCTSCQPEFIIALLSCHRQLISHASDVNCLRVAPVQVQ